MTAFDLLNSSDMGGYSTDPSRPDYACPAYREMAPRWCLVSDIRAGTAMIRAKKDKYLPKFEAETPKDWDARVGMTFVADHYATTLEEHVGLVMADPIKLGEDVPPAIVDLTEDIDGEGNHLDVFAQSALDAALDLGHCVLFTDYPETSNITNRGEERQAKARPYVQLYPASDVLSWRTATVGGVKVLVQIVLREHTSEAEGEFGVEDCVRYREITQVVFYDQFTGRATGLGTITWRAWKKTDPGEGGESSFEEIGIGGTIVGPAHIAARIVYGGQKLGTLHSTPHLYGLALSNVEETQVASDYASVMHKVNVPTPIFIGRNTQGMDGTATTVQMGQGIDIPIGGDAKMMEPSGNALNATRQRLVDIQLRMQRQGASTAQGETAKPLTATEAAQTAKAKNAKLRRAARSLQDALEGVLADMAAFMATKGGAAGVISGGSVSIDQNFAGLTIDPAYLTVLVTAYTNGTLTMEELRYAIQTGRLPETFDPEDVLDLIAKEAAAQDAAKLQAKAEADRLAAGANPSNADPAKAA